MNKPVNCGCGGEAKVEEWVGRWYVRCQKSNCLISTKNCDTEAEAITAWNRAMGERTAKVVSDDVIITVNGYRYHYDEYTCNVCKKKVFSCDSYCSHCGAKLDWSGNE